MIDSLFAGLEDLDRIVAPVAAWLGTFALHSTALLALTLGITRLLGRRRLSLQDGLLRQALWLPLVSATLQVTVWTEAPAGAAPAELDVLQLEAMIDAAERAASDVAPVAAPWAAEPAVATPWAAMAFLVAGLFSVVGVFTLFRTWRQLRRMLAARRPETDPRVLSAAAELADRLGLRQSPGLSRAEGLFTPIAFGMLRPEICLPARVARLDDASLRAMLGHELAHVRRMDSVWMWLAAWLHALFPWQLLLIGVRRQWSRVVELRCDAEAAMHTSRTAVARCLVEVAEWLRPESRTAAMALQMAARPSALRERVEAALETGSQPVARRLLAGGVAAVSLATMTVAAPRVDAGAPRSERGLVFETAPSSRIAADVLQPYVVLVDSEYTEIVREAQRLREQLAVRAALDPRAASRMNELDRRMQILSRLRGRLGALVDRIPSITR